MRQNFRKCSKRHCRAFYDRLGVAPPDTAHDCAWPMCPSDREQLMDCVAEKVKQKIIKDKVFVEMPVRPPTPNSGEVGPDGEPNGQANI